MGERCNPRIRDVLGKIIEGIEYRAGEIFCSFLRALDPRWCSKNGFLDEAGDFSENTLRSAYVVCFAGGRS